MALSFLTKADFEAAVLQQLLNERSEENLDDILEQKEAIAISMVKSQLSAYDVDSIFNAEGTNRNWLIIHYVVSIAVYLFFKRNAARKVPKEHKDDYDAVMVALDKILEGKLIPSGLPKAIQEDGTTDVKPKIANRKTNDYYI